MSSSPSWLQSLMANASEQKYSFIVASIATVAVAATVIWASFFNQQEASKPTAIKNTKAIQVTERPQIPSQAKPTPTTAPSRSEKSVTKKETQRQTTPQKLLVIGQGNLYVQVGAFKQPNLARLSFEKMKKQYKRAKIINKSGLYVIWVGPVITKSDAERLKKHIQRRNNIRGFIVSEK